MLPEVVESGELTDDNLYSLAESCDKAIIAKADLITHWWRLKMPDGTDAVYFGTEEMFQEWMRSHLQ